MGPIECAIAIGKYLLTLLGWPFLKPHVDYWWHFDDNIQELRDGIRDLDRQVQDVRQMIEGVRRRAMILRPGVEDWANAGTNMLERARISLPDDNIPKPWNLISRYSMGKSARKTTEEIAKHLEYGNFGTISISQRQITDFESRKRIEEEIMESLRNISISTIAICGMGGVGKTSMVEKIRKRVREENLFDEVAIVVVTQQVDMLKIQKEIAEWLGLTFNAESMSVRAQQLRTRLMDKKRKIVIFDDVWESLKFEDLGILFGFERCKILLASRFRDICEGIKNKMLTNLQTLSLFDCGVQEISIIGELTSLEILSFDGCPDITELPEEIGKLTRLRSLRLHHCKSLQTIAFGLISTLVQLEELKIVDCFRRWEAKQTGKARRNASLGELEFLSNLACLEIEIDDWNLAFEDINISQNLVKYRITINAGNYYSIEERVYEKVMNLNLPENIGVVGNWIQMLVKNTEYLRLKGDSSKNFNMAELENLRELKGDGSNNFNIEEFIFRNCSTVEELSNKTERTNLNQDVSLRYLQYIEIRDCSNLRFLFSVSVARTSLLQLQVLEIRSCDKLEQVFWNESRDKTDACIEFPKLKELTLINLPNLTAFCHGLENIIKFPMVTKMWFENLPKLNSLSSPNSEAAHDDTTSFHFLCNEKIIFGNLKKLFICERDNNIRNNPIQISIDFFNKLKELTVSNLNGIRSLMSYSMAKNLVCLQYLEIGFCQEIVEVIEGDDNKQVVDIQCLFPDLKNLKIQHLPKLRRFWKWKHTLELPLLEHVDIIKCPMMEIFTLGSLNTPKIRSIIIDDTELQKKDLNDDIRSSYSFGDKKTTWIKAWMML